MMAWEFEDVDCNIASVMWCTTNWLLFFLTQLTKKGSWYLLWSYSQVWFILFRWSYVSAGRITYYSIFCFSASTSSVGICEVGGLGMLRARQFLDEKWKGQSEIFLVARNTSSSMYRPALASIVLEKQTDVLWQGASGTCQLRFNLCTFQSAKEDGEKDFCRTSLYSTWQGHIT
jgi:hypothetical protein